MVSQHSQTRFVLPLSQIIVKIEGIEKNGNLIGMTHGGWKTTSLVVLGSCAYKKIQPFDHNLLM